MLRAAIARLLIALPARLPLRRRPRALAAYERMHDERRVRGLEHLIGAWVERGIRDAEAYANRGRG